MQETQFVEIDGAIVELEFVDEILKPLMRPEMTLTEAIEIVRTDPLWPVRLHMWRHS